MAGRENFLLRSPVGQVPPYTLQILLEIATKESQREETLNGSLGGFSENGCRKIQYTGSVKGLKEIIHSLGVMSSLWKIP